MGWSLIRVWSVHIDKFFYCPACHHISHERYKSSFSCLLANVKDQFFNENGCWFGRKKRNWKIYLSTLSLLYKIEEHSALDWNIFALLNMMTFSILARKETDRIYSNQNHLKNHSIFLCKKDTLQPTSLPRLLVILFSKLQVLLITVVVLTTNNLIYLSCHSHIDHHLISAIAKKDNNLIL